jgi:hypothetical protein
MLSMKVIFYIVLLFLILGIFDLWFQRYNHIKQLKMTKQEIKDEARSQDGDPLVKGKIKQIQYEMAQRRMMEEVPEATVVVTNPTFLAIAIKYEKGMQAPLVVAKGMKKDKARRGDEEYSIYIKSRYKNVIEFGARQTKRGVSAKVWGKRKIYRGAFIGGGRNSGKRLVFKKLKDEMEKGLLKKMPPEHLIVNIVSLCVYPFLVKNIIKEMFKVDDTGLERFYNERRKEITQFIIDAVVIK